MKRFVFILFFFKNVQASECILHNVIRQTLDQSHRQESLLLLLISQQKIIIEQQKIVENIIHIQKKIDKKQKKLNKSIVNVENMLFGVPGRAGVFSRLDRVESFYADQLNMNLYFLDHIDQVHAREHRDLMMEDEGSVLNDDNNYEMQIYENDREMTG